IRRTVRPRGYASGFDSPATLLRGSFEQSAGVCSSRPRRPGYRCSALLKWLFFSLLSLITVLEVGGGSLWADEGPLLGPRTLVVALDGTGDFTSLQEAVDAAKKGDTVFVKAGQYPQDVTIHSKEKIKFVGAGMDQVTILGRDIVVGALHVGKWPYGATDIEISDMTINDHGGHAVGLFNGQGIVLRRLNINGMLFSQQVHDVRIEDCIIGGSETTGAQFADSEAVLTGNFIHDNDHGVSIAGKSNVRLERNVITRSLFEAVVVSDRAKAVLVSNTLVKNGGGAAFLGQSQSDVTGNVVGLNRVGFVIAPSSRISTAFNAFYNTEGDYLRVGNPNQPAPELKAQSDITGDPYFVDAVHDDFRLRLDTPLLKIGHFPYLGALAPASTAARRSTEK
ncbi:MAG: pectinesterase family protein, partial [Nitrospirota bacterium]